MTGRGQGSLSGTCLQGRLWPQSTLGQAAEESPSERLRGSAPWRDPSCCPRPGSWADSSGGIFVSKGGTRFKRTWAWAGVHGGPGPAQGAPAGSEGLSARGQDVLAKPSPGPRAPPARAARRASDLCSPEHLSMATGSSTGLLAKPSPSSDPARLPLPSTTCRKHWRNATLLDISPCPLAVDRATVRDTGRPPKRAMETPTHQTPFLPVSSRDPSTDRSSWNGSTLSPDGRGDNTPPPRHTGGPHRARPGPHEPVVSAGPSLDSHWLPRG